MAPNLMMMGVTLMLAFATRSVLDTEDSFQTGIVRGLYGVSQFVCYCVLVYLYVKTLNNTEPGVVTVKEDLGFGQTGDRDEKITVAEHDQRAVIKELQRTALGTLMTLLMHWKWGFFPPLVIQTVTQPVNLFQAPIVKVILMGERAWGELRRPWLNRNDMSKSINSWNNTILSAMGESPAKINKKASKKAAKRKNK
ncbi:RxLR-like protein [Plasmopara halstedii]|uniref:RxLR-like protein n=1 Tax=Plasmopara halstedii TaxID=4781 RepID=A0A0P1AR72_PLAHL|nr:RxLR-like protein [Plasmopara halstedii]CEG44022.1 RxLR-like protein [Plasmopara halstedii]|eukprot:XP_024580391.1 RxLR-like protein [Plasmopara halstedii]